MIETIESPYIHAITADNFESMVLDNSNIGPVLVNFWSKKAGPCLRQYPILDQIIHKYQGKLLLVNVDTETEIKITKEYGIASVPTLKLFRYEEVVESLHGFQSEDDLIKLLDRYVAKESDQTLGLAIEHYSQGDREQAYDMITQAIIEDPINMRLPVALCKLLMHEQRYDEALQLLQTLPPNISNLGEITQLRDELEFIVIANHIEDVDALIKQVETPSDPKASEPKSLMQLSAFYALNHEYELALKVLVNLIEIQPEYHDEYARKAMLKLFNMLGGHHELVKKYRPALSKYTH